MNKAQFIFLALVISALVGFYNVVNSVVGLQVAEQKVDKTQNDLSVAIQEEGATQDRYDNVVRYGCANPTVGQGFVMCP